jgi:hypothetical protein
MKQLSSLLGLLLCSQPMASIDIDLANSGAQVQAKDTIRLRNVNVLGYGNYYVDFKWDSVNMVMTVVRADKDTLSQLAATSKQYTATSGTGTLTDFNQICVQEYGAQYQQSDWQDIKSAIGSDPNALQSFKSTISAVPSNIYFVKYGNQVSNKNGTLNYLVSKPTSTYADIIQSDIALYQKHGNFTGQVICVKTGNTNPLTK